MDQARGKLLSFALGVDHELLCDWIEESYRIVAPKRLGAVLDTSRVEVRAVPGTT